MRKGKLFGQEFELDEQLDNAQHQAVEAAEKLEVDARRVPLLSPKGEERTSELNEIIDIEVKALEFAAKVPKLGLLHLSTEIERLLLRKMAGMGLLKSRRPATMGKLIQVLDERKQLPSYLRQSVKAFSDIRNRLVHGRSASDRDVYRALDIGLVVLRTVAALPAERNFVRAVVPVFSDPQCETERDDVRAVILETKSPGGSEMTLRVFPSTQQYEAGREVTYEWNMSRTWGESWYRDQASNEIKLAWSQAAEFAGRYLDEI